MEILCLSAPDASRQCTSNVLVRGYHLRGVVLRTMPDRFLCLSHPRLIYSSLTLLRSLGSGRFIVNVEVTEDDIAMEIF